nr:MAG: putative RNA-dependent RNA polymerase [Leucocoprinus alphapartitivirus 1]
MFTELWTRAKKFFGFEDPHDFKHNFKFIGYASKDWIPSNLRRDEETRTVYQIAVERSLRHCLKGSDADFIINNFHHPIATMEMIKDTLSKGDLPDHPIPQDDHFLRAFNAAADAFRPPQRLRPVHFVDLLTYKWNWHPNVEEPYFSDRKLRTAVQDAHSAGLLPDGRMSFGNLVNVVFDRTRAFLHNIKRGLITDPLSLYPIMKIHVKPALTTKDELKTRVIYGVSKHHVLAQAMFFWPLFRHYIESDSDPLLWGYETILGGMQKLHDQMSVPKLYFQTFVTVDWSGFDLRSVFSLQRKVFDTWRTYFDFENGYIPTKHYRHSKADPKHLENLWNWQRDACFAMPFMLPDRSMYIRQHRSIPSGLFTTQFLDSHVNYIMILTILDAMGFDISKVRLLVQGDDSLSMLVFFIPADKHAEFKARFEVLAAHYFDHVARHDKTDIHNSPQNVGVLGYHNDNGLPVRDWRKLLAQLYHPRGAPSLAVLRARCCGIVYADMYRHRQVVDVCKDIYNRLGSESIPVAKLRGFRDVILQGEAGFEVPTDHFPTESEVTAHLRIPYRRTEEDRNSYWPSNYFLDTK